MKIAVKQYSDNTPGYKNRYVLQEVNYSPELPICVSIDGICNHADTDHEIHEDVNGKRYVQFCTKCNIALVKEL